MQSVVTTTDIEYTDNKRKPSAKLQEKIKNCVSMFRSLNETVNEIIELGQKEGFTPKEIGQFIRQEMIKSGLSTRTVTRYLPAELKAKPRGFQVSQAIRDKMSLNQNQSQSQSNQPISNENRDKMSLIHGQSQPIAAAVADIEQFSMADRHLYRPEFIGKVIDDLTKIYNEKTGQKIVIIFRKMVDNNGSSSGTTERSKDKNKDKKYQPTPDEVKQREQKIMSLVEEGIIRIAQLVEKSGVSETATRRYLQKAGYRVMEGTVSR